MYIKIQPVPNFDVYTKNHAVFCFTLDPVFGVALEIAVERSRLPDKIELPRVVRDCILFIEEKGWFLCKFLFVCFDNPYPFFYYNFELISHNETLVLYNIPQFFFHKLFLNF